MFEFVKKNKKIVYIFIITIALFIVITYLIYSCSHIFVESSRYDTEIKENRKLSMHIEKELEEVLVGVAKKNGDWTYYPLSKKFLAKYNSKEGIFSNHNFNSVDCFKRSLQQYDDDILSAEFQYRVGDNLTLLNEGPVWNIGIKYTLNSRDELDNIEILYDKQTVDEYGDPVRDYDKEFTEKNINLLNDILFFDHWCRFYSIYPDRPIIRKEPISSRLANKIWKDQEDVSKGFIDYFEGLDYTVGNVYWLKSKTKKEAFVNNDLYCICKLYKDGEEPYYDNEIDYEPIKNYLYKVDISFDDDKKLDDIKVRFIKEISNEECMEKYTARLVED